MKERSLWLVLGILILFLLGGCSQDLLNQVLGTTTTEEGTEINYEIMGLMLAYPSYSAVDAALNTAFDGIGREQVSGPIQIDTPVNVEATVRLTLNGTYTYDTGTLTIEVNTGSLSIEGTTPIYDEYDQRIADISQGTLYIDFSLQATVVENPDYPGNFYPSSLTIQSFTIDGSIPLDLRDSKYKDGDLEARDFKVSLSIDIPDDNPDASPYDFSYDWQLLQGSIFYADEDVTQKAFDELKIAFPQVLEEESNNDAGGY